MKPWVYRVLQFIGLKPRMTPEFEQVLFNAVSNAKGHAVIKKDDKGKWVCEQIEEKQGEK